MKKLLAVIMVAVLLCGCVACGQTTRPDDNSTPVSDVSTTTTAEDTTTTEGDTTTTEDVSVDDTTEDVSVDDTTADVSTEDTTTTKKPTTIKKPSTSTGGKNSTSKPTSTTATKKPSTTAATTSSKVLTTTTTKKPGTTSTTATTKSTKRTVTAKTTTTTTTTVTTTTTTTKDPNLKSIKVLSVGHSFSKDAMEAYLWDIFNSAGYDEIVLGYLYIGGCPLEKHWENVQGNKGAYEYAKNTSGRWVKKYNHKAKDALLDEDWDYVTFQPSPDYGGGPECCGGKNDYAHFNDLVNWVLDTATNPNVQIYYHLTWAFATDCRLWSFMYHDYDQMTQYNDFIAATKKYVLSNRDVKGVIPCNTSIQNARSSYLGDTFNMPGEFDANKDGYHLNDKGDYVASLTWYAFFSGEKASTVTFIPDEYKDAFPALAEAVDNAIKNPFKVTESSYK